jgi:DNA-binding MarR family transcriptional regulator
MTGMQNNPTTNSPKKDHLTMHMLSVLERNELLSQRRLADTLGIALGATNAHIKECLTSGLIQKKPTNQNRVHYQLTMKGHLEKSRLNSKFIEDSFDIFNKSKESFAEIFKTEEALKNHPFYIVGTTPLAETAFLSMENETFTNFKGFYAPNHQIGRFLDKQVFQQIDELEPHAVFLFALLENSLQAYEALKERVGKQRIFVPQVLKSVIK